MGAPRSLTPELMQKILAYVRAGNTPFAAARACGVAKSTWYGWLKDGRSGKDPDCEGLAEKLETALAASQAGLVALVRQAAQKDWRAAIALLERRWPSDWSRRDQHTLTHEVADPYPVLSPEEAAHLEELARMATLALRGKGEAASG